MDDKAEPSDRELLLRLRNGEVGAFDAIFDKYRRGILAYVLGITHDRQLAEDITQECFVELVKHREKVDPKRGMNGWLYRVARNRAIDVIRHRKFELPTEDTILIAHAEEDEAAPAPHLALSAKEAQAEMEAALQKLSPAERELLVLRFYGDLTFKEIARIMKRPLGTVLWKSRRALEKLRSEMQKESQSEM
jgi:RNA polymerase sigma-70 factor (ECF subfamily)